MKIKICGMREAENIKAVGKLQPDYMGFIFYSKSKRFVEQLDEDALGSLSPAIRKTGVFVNESYKIIKEHVIKYDLQAIQLHGDEPAELCLFLKADGVEVIKAFGVDTGFNFGSTAPYLNCTDYFLFDTKTTQYGGSGQSFNWEVLKSYTFSKPYFLSGGIGPENISQVTAIADPRFYAIDLNSKFESEPALKDIEKLKTVFNYLKKPGVNAQKLEEI